MNKIKKFLVIGNPINHSLSPELQNYWLKKNNINAIYDKQRLDIDDLKDFVLKIKSKEIAGANITVPFKKEIIPFIDKLTPESEGTDSVNTILLNKGETVGYNTDIINGHKHRLYSYPLYLTIMVCIGAILMLNIGHTSFCGIRLRYLYQPNHR